MSFLRIRSPHHEPRDIPQGPSTARLSGNGGSIVVGESAKTVAERSRREYNARRDVEAKAAADHDYYLRNKARLRGEALLERVRKP